MITHWIALESKDFIQPRITWLSLQSQTLKSSGCGVRQRLGLWILKTLFVPNALVIGLIIRYFCFSLTSFYSQLPSTSYILQYNSHVASFSVNNPSYYENTIPAIFSYERIWRHEVSLLDWFSMSPLGAATCHWNFHRGMTDHYMFPFVHNIVVFHIFWDFSICLYTKNSWQSKYDNSSSWFTKQINDNNVKKYR